MNESNSEEREQEDSELPPQQELVDIPAIDSGLQFLMFLLPIIAVVIMISVKVVVVFIGCSGGLNGL
jgi:hypothetical protein